MNNNDRLMLLGLALMLAAVLLKSYVSASIYGVAALVAVTGNLLRKEE